MKKQYQCHSEEEHPSSLQICWFQTNHGTNWEKQVGKARLATSHITSKRTLTSHKPYHFQAHFHKTGVLKDQCPLFSQWQNGHKAASCVQTPSTSGTVCRHQAHQVQCADTKHIRYSVQNTDSHQQQASTYRTAWCMMAELPAPCVEWIVINTVCSSNNTFSTKAEIWTWYLPIRNKYWPFHCDTEYTRGI
jgi:hypothetical protein